LRPARRTRYHDSRVGAEEQPARLLRPGTQLGRYAIVKRIGCGGMAEVYLARSDAMGGFAKAVALKVVHAHLVQEPVAVKSFLREARLAATLDHPNIVQVLDVGVMGGEHTLVMEHLHGRDVGGIMSTLDEGEPMPLPCALRIVLDVCAALEYAHAKRGANDEPLAIVHRDVSPSNVLVGFNGVVKLTDFGIAKIGAQSTTTTAGMLKGKFGYMSPEQSLGQPVDARSDVFSLGILLYETTTGARAFYGANAFAIMNSVIEGEYVPPNEVRPDYPPALADIVARCLMPEVELRYDSVAALRRELEAFAVTVDVADGSALATFMRALFEDPPAPDLWAIDATTERIRPTPTTRRIASRRWRASAIAGGALVVGLVIGASVSGRSSEAEPPPATTETSSPTVEAVAPEPTSAPQDEEVVIVDDEETPSASEPARDSSKRKRNARRSTRRPAMKPAQHPKPASDPDGMFPSSMK
jgi:eukaryotic-like serine/threonine-protein kinase